MASKLTSAQWVKQQLYYFCGPAVAQMVLQSAGATAVTQNTLFDEIIAASSGTPHAGIGRLPGFPKQHCLKCANETVWFCWFSAPAALRKVINARIPGNALSLIKAAPSRQKGAITRIVKTINAGVAATFLTDGDHWRVVWGYEFGPALDLVPATNYGGIAVNGFYVHDPDPALEGQSLTLQSVATFRSDFAVVNCGPGILKQHVAIVT